MSSLRLPLNDERVIDLLAWWGTPYTYGAGRPSHALTCWPPADPPATEIPAGKGARGADCSGLTQVCLVRLGLLAANAPDRGAAALCDASVPVEEGEEQLGDLAFYGVSKVSHVVLVLGRGVVLSASNGTSKTFGADPRAFAQLQRLHYRADLRGVRRLKASEALPRAAAGGAPS